MKRKMILALGILGAFAFSNFVSAENLKKKADFETRMNANYVGIHYNDLVSKLGKPQNLFKTADGVNVAQYVYNERMTFGGDTYAYAGTPNAYAPNNAVFLGSFQENKTDLFFAQTPTVSSQLNCVRRFAIDEDGIVYFFAYDGNSCYQLK